MIGDNVGRRRCKVLVRRIGRAACEGVGRAVCARELQNYSRGLALEYLYISTKTCFCQEGREV